MIDVDGLAGNTAAVAAEKEQAGDGDFVDMPLLAERDAGTLLSMGGLMAAPRASRTKFWVKGSYVSAFHQSTMPI